MDRCLAKQTVAMFSFVCVVFYLNKFCSRRRLEGHPLQVRHKQNWGRGFILLLPQAVVLPESDANSDAIKPALNFVIQPSDLVLHVVPDVWGKLLEHCLQFVQERHTRNLVKERDPFVNGRMELPNTSLQAVELNPSYSG